MNHFPQEVSRWELGPKHVKGSGALSNFYSELLTKYGFSAFLRDHIGRLEDREPSVKIKVLTKISLFLLQKEYLYANIGVFTGNYFLKKGHVTNYWSIPNYVQTPYGQTKMMVVA